MRPCAESKCSIFDPLLSDAVPFRPSFTKQKTLSPREFCSSSRILAMANAINRSQMLMLNPLVTSDSRGKSSARGASIASSSTAQGRVLPQVARRDEKGCAKGCANGCANGCCAPKDEHGRLLPHELLSFATGRDEKGCAAAGRDDEDHDGRLA